MECLRVGWAVGAEENKNPRSARGSERFASKQGPRKMGNKDSNLQELMELATV